jgi:hypothetical protein
MFQSSARKAALTHAESYRGFAIHVWTVGQELFGWGFTIDLVERVDSADSVGKRQHTALVHGLIAARARIDQRLGPAVKTDRPPATQADDPGSALERKPHQP